MGTFAWREPDVQWCELHELRERARLALQRIRALGMPPEGSRLIEEAIELLEMNMLVDIESFDDLSDTEGSEEADDTPYWFAGRG